MADYSYTGANITYPDNFNFITINGSTNGVRVDDMGYGDNNETWYLGDPVRIHISEHTSYSDPLTLITLDNGVKIKYTYKTRQHGQSAMWDVDMTVQYCDLNGEPFAAYNLDTMTVSSVSGSSTDSVYYYPTKTNYDHSNSIYGGDPASIILGTFLYPTGSVAWADMVQDITNSHYTRKELFTNGGWGTVSAQALSENFFNDFVDAGNGKPFVDNPASGEGDTSGTGGGTGDYKPRDGKSVTGDPVGHPGLPSVGVIGTGLLSVYVPTAVQLRDLAQELWSSNFFDTISKILNDPFDGMISLSMVPFSVPTGSSTIVSIGNYTSQVSMARAGAQYVTISGGSLSLSENWGSALDYSPYTKVSIFLPGVGFRPLKTEDVMGKSLSVSYNVDILTGAAVCTLQSSISVLYEFPCNFAYQIPLTGSSMSGLYAGIIHAGVALASGALVGGTAGAVAATGLTSAVNVATSKGSEVERGGSLAGNGSILGHLTPYLVIHRPIQSLAADFRSFAGYPSNITATLGNCTGFTVVEEVHLDIGYATDTEKVELLNILKAGIVI